MLDCALLSGPAVGAEALPLAARRMESASKVGPKGATELLTVEDPWLDVIVTVVC